MLLVSPVPGTDPLSGALPVEGVFPVVGAGPVVDGVTAVSVVVSPGVVSPGVVSPGVVSSGVASSGISSAGSPAVTFTSSEVVWTLNWEALSGNVSETGSFVVVPDSEGSAAGVSVPDSAFTAAAVVSSEADSFTEEESSAEEPAPEDRSPSVEASVDGVTLKSEYFAIIALKEGAGKDVY